MLQSLFNRDHIDVVDKSVNAGLSQTKSTFLKPTTTASTIISRPTTTKSTFLRRPITTKSTIDSRRPTSETVIGERPAFISRPLTTSRTTPATSTTTTQRTTTLSVRSFKPQMQQQTLFEQIKNRINNAKSEPTEKKNPDELMNELIQKRVEEELARRKQEEEKRIEEERLRLLAAEVAKKEKELKSQFEQLVSAAGNAVNLRIESRTDKSSPAVWASVRKR